MTPHNLRLESLPEGLTLISWDCHLHLGDQVHTQRLQFAVRLSQRTVERLVAESGPERVVSLLWTHFRAIPLRHGMIDSDRASLEEWSQAVEALLTEVNERSHPGNEHPFHAPPPSPDASSSSG